ncbi:MAG: hypothetical protein JKY56_08915 [Kofleriaceae bacterium]|nr:hypothetical protein [Kofleriaceae bacterium]
MLRSVPESAYWESLPLSEPRFAIEKPGQLYFRVEMILEATDPLTGRRNVTIRTIQDHNCDGILGISTIAGSFVRGLPPIGLGWDPTLVEFAPLYE